MIDVRWGNLGMKDEYVDWLTRKNIMGWITASLFIVGSGVFIVLASKDDFGFWECLSLVLWVFLVTISAGLLSYVNRRLHSIENFIGFHEDRYRVRHKVYCTSHIDCLGTHYFKSFEDDETGESS